MSHPYRRVGASTLTGAKHFLEFEGETRGPFANAKTRHDVCRRYRQVLNPCCLCQRQRMQAFSHRIGGDDVAIEAKVRIVDAQRHADELGEVENRQVEGRLHDPGGVRLLRIQVQVTEWAGRDHEVGALPLCFANVVAGHCERIFAIHRDDGEAAALLLAGVVHRCGAACFNDHLKVAPALGKVVVPKDIGGGAKYSSRKRAQRSVR